MLKVFKRLFFDELISKSMMVYQVMVALLAGAKDLGSVTWQKSIFYLLLEVKIGTYMYPKDQRDM